MGMVRMVDQVRVGLYLTFNLSWVLRPFVPGRVQNLQTREDTFRHGLTPSRLSFIYKVFFCRSESCTSSS